MINATDRVVYLLNQGALHLTVCNAAARAIELIKSQAGPLADQADRKIFGFAKLLSAPNRPVETEFGPAFLDAALEFCLANSQNTDTTNCLATLRDHVRPVSLPATSLAGLKRGFKLMLVELWRVRSLLLPTIFSPAAHFPYGKFEHELLGWVQRFDPRAPSDGSGKAGGHRLYYYGPRLLLATDWRSPEEVNLEQLAVLHRAQNLYRQGLADTIIAGGTQLPLTLFAAQLQRDFPDRVSYTAAALADYSSWTLSKSDETFIVGKVRRSKLKRSPAPRSLQRRKAPIDHAATVGAAQQASTHDAIVLAYQALQRGRPPSIDWTQGAVPFYPGREHVDLADVSRTWVMTFKAFLHHRKHVQGYRSDDDTISSLNLLADYLFFYLPWWKQLHPDGNVKSPAAPRHFTRFAFVTRHTDAPLEELPLPLLTLIGLRRPSKDSAAVAVHQIARYFDYVGTHFADDDAVAGTGFKSPVNAEFDAPRVKKRNKTTKEIIPKQVYGYLLFYCYAVEEFGQHLQQLALAGQQRENRTRLRCAQHFVCADFGLTPMIHYRGREIPLERAPNVFTWAEREIGPQDGGEPLVAYIPHISALRLLITSLETGLRCQSVQWLDRSTWDAPNATAPADNYIFALRVNTDKTRVREWTTYVVHRVRALLRREQEFQDRCLDADEAVPVNYEGLENSPFEPIRPLFRAINRFDPIGDHAYNDAWTRLLAEFESFYQSVTGENQTRMVRLKRLVKSDGAPVIRFRGKMQGPYCALSTLAIHTPHACRATFATNRQGLLELSDVADLLGHQSEVVTAHYTKPSSQMLQDRLRASDAALIGDFELFDVSSTIHIRADRKDSALVRSFVGDREGTVRRFRFMPSIGLWSTGSADEDEEGLRLLKEGPMSRIRFRETHICPVGEECPGDIVEKVGAPRRCGACPLAMKCIDHLPAIAAKKNQLLERIQYLRRRREMMEGRGEPSAVLDEVWEELELDVNELLGWQLSEEILTNLRARAGSNHDAQPLHVDSPEIVRRHLERVSRRSNGIELVLQRIADSNAYPSLATPQVQAAAGRLKRRLLAGVNIPAADTLEDGLDDLGSAASLLSTVMKSTGASLTDVAAMLAAPTALGPESFLLTETGHG